MVSYKALNTLSESWILGGFEFVWLRYQYVWRAKG